MVRSFFKEFERIGLTKCMFWGDSAGKMIFFSYLEELLIPF